MIIVCSRCRVKLRIDAARYAGKNLSLVCRRCGSKFSYSVPPSAKILLAHGEPEVCRTILEVCRQDVGEILTCSDAEMTRKLLARHSFSALLLDVALPGVFPFQLIEEVRSAGDPLKIVLLPSVYNRTAYKRKPSSLYGADAYLELHHLSDQLIPLLHDLLPHLALKSSPRCPMNGQGEERPLAVNAELAQQAEELARLLIADIALYHQEQIDLGIASQDLETRLSEQLTEGRRLLAGRIPQIELDKQDYLLTALMRFSAARAEELRNERKDSHG